MQRWMIISLLGIVLSACATASDTGTGGVEPVSASSPIVVAGADQNGSTFTLRTGQRLSVELVSAAGAPYEWVALETPPFLRLVASEKIAAPPPAGGPPIVGGPVTNRFVFEATGPGAGRLRLGLRSFVNEREVAQTWTATVEAR